jgi:7-cyano-7-deazaguanine synthase
LNTKNLHIIVLLSGGIDSAATLAVYRKQRARVSAMFFDYGQPARRSEWAAAQGIAHHYGVKVTRVRLGFRLANRNGEFFGRNAVFALAAAATHTKGPLVIATGIHALSPYYDTTPSFIADVQRLFDGYSSGSVTLAAPFSENNKADVVKFARRRRVPIHITYSCERRNAPPCGKCASCEDRAALHV